MINDQLCAPSEANLPFIRAITFFFLSQSITKKDSRFVFVWNERGGAQATPRIRVIMVFVCAWVMNKLRSAIARLFVVAEGLS